MINNFDNNHNPISIPNPTTVEKIVLTQYVYERRREIKITIHFFKNGKQEVLNYMNYLHDDDALSRFKQMWWALGQSFEDRLREETVEIRKSSIKTSESSNA